MSLPMGKKSWVPKCTANIVNTHSPVAQRHFDEMKTFPRNPQGTPKESPRNPQGTPKEPPRNPQGTPRNPKS